MQRIEVGGNQTEEGHYLIYGKMLWLALWTVGFGRVKAKDKAGRPAEGMVSFRTEMMGVDSQGARRKGSRARDDRFLTWDVRKEKKP